MENRKLKPIVIFTGPSGVGKGTIEKFLFAYDNLKLAFSVSVTTRAPRQGEINGVNYFFVTKEDFKNKIANDELLEYNFHFDNYYGTLYKEIEKIHAEGNIPFLEIETQGAKKILSIPNIRNKFNIITFFVLPPSFAELEKRMLNRNTEDDEAIKLRLIKAKEELKEKDIFDYHIVNDIPEEAANEIKNIILKEIN
ncbi:Guanylate kinase [Mycoplasmopsis meleagridis]|uniref:Guanylate kinase n=1 Tax=Mycoplasmopsis meleagridis ATCC 25294 TaxID=1264554 RepID=A0A0F5H1E8_9BACT|nr:guanylate kinase [Mycoplasmopsis meleagridis]KKB26687.1 Guanylate kinase [Mycoplasmopsis meleagridis ATCC 25294]OAD18197.1 Guanylate kinase [Mycoplasmopsis meleagridis]VEU77742.1 guanylate kinase [Mycoplasmopsis meleagridis]